MIFAGDILSAVVDEECKRIADLAAGRIALELGSHFGRSTIALASTAQRVHAVDWHMGDQHAGFGESLNIFLANIARYGVREKVTIHVAKFEELLPLFASHSFGFAFIDGLHTYEAVTSDIRMTAPLMRSDGWMAFHDYNDVPGFGVKQAVTEFANKNNLKVHVHRTVASVRLTDKPLIY